MPRRGVEARPISRAVTRVSAQRSAPASVAAPAPPGAEDHHA
jgi:hypothetical protein